MSRPNILFLFSDQQRWDTVNCYGNPIFPGITPHLDQLASEGVRFQNTFTMQPVCGPARSCLQSGMYATQTGCHTNNIALPLDGRYLAHELNDAGYETAYVGKWHLASDNEHNFRMKAVPKERRGGYRDYWMVADALEFTSHGYEGFFHDINDERVDWEGYRVDRTADFVMDYLRDYSKRKGVGETDKPFFMFASFIEPHHQNDLDRYIGPIGSKEKYADYNVPGDLVDTQGDWHKHMADYLGCCASLDENVGRIRKLLDELGLAEDTLIIYTSDHGSHFRTRNDEYKRSCHESSLRVPLIMAGPGATGFAGGQVRKELVSLIDLPATVLEVAGAKVPEHYMGRPLQKLARDNVSETDWGDDVYAQISEAEVGRTVRTKKWKYAVNDPQAMAQGKPRPMFGQRYVEAHLYDLEADPHERNNLVADPSLADVRAEMRKRMKKYMQQVGEPEVEIVAAG